ncbi:MAG: PAS domain S-box protein [Phycisphaerae bacterium]|nr:PAS domain S-box protein [Phycisphaerae bacterium]
MAIEESSARSRHSSDEYATALFTEDAERNHSPSPSFLDVLDETFHKIGSPPRNVREALQRLTRELHDADEKLRLQSLILNHIRDTITATDLEGRITYVNDAAVEFFKYAREELIGKTVDIYGCDPSRGATQKEMIRETLDKGTWHGEVVNRCSDGQEKFVDCHTWIMRDERGNPIGLCGVGSDITERKRDEQERELFEEHLRDTEKLQSLGVLAGGIAHDFNNLLVGVLGNADLALRDLPETTPTRECVESIRNCALRATELTKQMLAYAGKAQFHIQPVHLNKLISETASLLWTSVTRKAQLRYQLTNRLPAVRADMTQLRQVLMNLITNASEAVGNNSGFIHIRTDVEDLSREEIHQMYLGEHLDEGQYVTLEVSDTGIGMDADTLTKMFEPFFTTKFTGRGLGLSAVLGIVRAHKGAIRVQSSPGVGTSFRLYLPACDDKVETPREDTNGKATLWKGRGLVMVVDDEPSVLGVADMMLQRLGFDTILANNGPEALEQFARRKDEILAVLLDMSMPAMDGQDTLEALRNVRPDARVILCSGYSREVAAERFSDAALAGYLQKPFELASVSQALQAVLA